MEGGITPSIVCFGLSKRSLPNLRILPDFAKALSVRLSTEGSLTMSVKSDDVKMYPVRILLMRDNTISIIRLVIYLYKSQVLYVTNLTNPLQGYNIFLKYANLFTKKVPRGRRALFSELAYTI